MRLRTLAAAAVAITLTLGIAGPSLADTGKVRGRDKSAQGARPAKARAEARAEAKSHKAEAQARRKARFVAVGIVTAVSGDSITLAVKGGSARQLRGRTQAFTVASGASVIRNGQTAAVSAIQNGDHAMLKGTWTADTYNAHKVRAQSREQKPAEPSPGAATGAP